MKKNFGIFLLAALLFGSPVFAQRSAQVQVSGVGFSATSLEDNGYFKPKKKKKKKSKKDEDELPWKDKIWYGAGGTLNYGSNGQSSAFQIGLQPMAGYKILPFWSVGPRVGMDYISYRKITDESGFLTNQSGWITTLGLFTRLRFWNLFVHAETSEQFVRLKKTIIGQNESKTLKDKFGNQYVGLGWNEGRNKQVGYEFAILMNIKVLKDENSTLQPFEIRGGLTYNF